ncbi:MAG: TIGR02757 family protein [Bacteroidales bacterium]
MKHSLTYSELADFLDEKVDLYNCEAFIESDPIQIPKQFDDPRDIEIAGFMAATIAWGQRRTIIANMNKLLEWMGNTPYDFLLNADDDDLYVFSNFKHRTFNGEDCIYFLKSLQNLYRNYGGLGRVFQDAYMKHGAVPESLKEFRKLFFKLPHSRRTQKHVADISKGSAAKRLNMFLRWMVRNDKRGIDFGLWNQINSKDLYIPLDIHSGTVARKLGLLKRKQNDWHAVEELTTALRKFDPDDPVKYDFALFGLGVFEKF